MTRKGMSLTEVLVAMALVTLCIGGIVTLIVQGMGLGQSADYMFVATNLANNKIEKVRFFYREMGYDALPEAAESDVKINRNGAPDNNGDFKRTTLINTASGLTKVTVRVSYKIRSAFLSQYVEMVTLFSPYD